ncbi:MAG: ferric reductase-like transmembrane domain-containing protein [Deltaproteobacteria bacterium]|nr:ferric reductase-like transmembrane domain-containing protein [Deltaproteobacteria bacterium]
MSTSELGVRAAPPVFDASFAKRFVQVCALVPALLLAWDAYQHQLGVNDVNFAIRSTGLVGLLFLTLALVITPLRRLTGWNAILPARRPLGVYGFLYIAAHFLIFFAFDRAGSVGSTLTEIVERVYLWFGTAALVLMIPLAITSTDGMVTRLGPRRWKLLHRLTYVVVAFGVVHVYLLVKADTGTPIAFAIIGGALMLYRLVQHYVDLRHAVTDAKAKVTAARAAGAKAKPKAFWSGELVVAKIFDETPDVKTFRMVSPDGGPLPFTHVAGQYLNLALTIDGVRVNRSYTIASSPTRSAYCEISVKAAASGYASKHLHATLKAGSRLKVSAPAGKFVFAGHEAKRIVLLAGGVGITPMMSVVRSLTDRGWDGEMFLVFAVRTSKDIVFKDELAYLQARFPNLHVRYTLSQPEDDWTGARGNISRELLNDFIPSFTRGPVMVCGPAPMMTAMRALLVDMGVPDAEVHDEAFVSPPTMPTPAAADTEMAEMNADTLAPSEAGVVVRFKKAGVDAEVVGLTVLEAAEEAGVAIPFECRSGICGQCKTHLVSGRVAMETQDALTAADRAKGLILACQARPVRDVVVDA